MHSRARTPEPQSGREVDPRASGRAPGPTLWAVASGKGGVGKSVVSSSLAIGLAATGPRAVAIDLDLGGANLHSVFGCVHSRHTITDVLRGQAEMEEALVETTVPGVRLLSGARAGLDAANPHYQQKQKLLRSLRRIDVGHVVMDLGAGSAFNTLDAFLAADRRILVTTPEPTAVENSYHFLKAAFFRSLRAVAREPEVRAVLESILERARREGATPRELVEAAARADADVGARLREQVNTFEIDLIVNRSDLSSLRRDPGIELAAATRAQLGANLRLAASLPNDSAVPAAIERGVPVLQLFPGTAFSHEMRRTVERLIEDEPIPTAPAAAPNSRSRRAAPATVAAPATPPMPRFDGRAPGAHLRACRELLGLALNQLHERTRIRHHYLEGIEREDFAQLPPEFYLQAYVRQMALALDLPDAERIAESMVLRAREFAAARKGLRAAPTDAGGGDAPREEVPSACELVAAVDFEPELEGFASPVEGGTPVSEVPVRSAPDRPPEPEGAAPVAPGPANAVPRAPKASADAGATKPTEGEVAAAGDSTNSTIAALLQREEGVGFARALARLHATDPAREVEHEAQAGRVRAAPPARRRRRRRLRR